MGKLFIVSKKIDGSYVAAEHHANVIHFIKRELEENDRKCVRSGINPLHARHVIVPAESADAACDMLRQHDEEDAARRAGGCEECG